MAILSKSTSLASKTIKNISNILLNRSATRKNLSNSILSYKNKRANYEKIQRIQDEVGAPLRILRPDGARSLSLSSVGESFTKRILSFIGYVGTGWLLSNMPTWIAAGRQLSQRIESLNDTFTGFVNNIGELMRDIGRLSNAFYNNIVNLDFSDSSYRIRNSLSDLTLTLDSMGNQITEAFKVLTAPFENLPPLGTEPGPGAYPPADQYPPGGLPDPQSAEMYRIAAALSTEGSGAQSTVDMMQVVVNRKAMGYGKTYTTILAGKDQFEGVEKKGVGGFLKIQTLEDASRWSGQSKNALLGIIKNIQDPTLQAKAAKHVGGALQFRGSPATVRKVNSDNNPNNNIQADANGRIPGSSWRGGNGDNQFITSNPAGAKYVPIRPGGAADFNLPAPVAKPTPTTPGAIPTAVIDEVNVAGPKGGTAKVGRSGGRGEYLARGGAHKGIDIGTSRQKGYYVSFKQSGKVVYAGWNDGGFGYLVIIRSGNLEFFFAHLAKIMVRNGSSYNGETIGEIGNTGRSQGEHLHFEVRVVGGGAINPEPYLGLLSIGRKFAAITGKPSQPLTSLAPSNTASLKVDGQEVQIESDSSVTLDQILQGLTQERKGRQIVLINDIQKPGAGTVMSSGGSSGLLVMNQAEVVNNFIKNKLLTDLSYL